jgi:hypothetical protein
MFDYRQLEQFHIPLSRLPQDSILINRPDSFYDRYKTLVWATVSVVSVLGFLVVLLSVAIIRQHRTERALKLSEEFLSSIVRTYDLDLHQGRPDLNSSVQSGRGEGPGIQQEELVGKNDTISFPMSGDFLRRTIENVESGGADIPEEVVTQARETDNSHHEEDAR